jgi:ubiquinone biosynthesis monooxygenase Coq7
VTDARRYGVLDRILIELDRGARAVFGVASGSGRPSPAVARAEAELSADERRESARLMRVNHAGEVCAQALYQGQAFTARMPHVRDSLDLAAQEEGDHLAWCAQRTRELGGHTSLLNPLWYGGSLAIGALAGLAGDRWSLGFLAETENQVVRHLDDHLSRLPDADQKSRAILEQMRDDEGRHATMALRAGGAPLPLPVRAMMKLTSKVMTKTAYWI